MVTIQTLFLYQLLERGYPQVLVFVLAGLVAANALIYAVDGSPSLLEKYVAIL